MKNKPAPSPKAASSEMTRHRLVHMQLGETDIDAVQISNEIAHDQKRDQSPHHLATITRFSTSSPWRCLPFCRFLFPV